MYFFALKKRRLKLSLSIGF